MSSKKNNKIKENEVKGKETFFVPTRDHSKDPYVVKKVESARRVFETYGFPKELLNS